MGDVNLSLDIMIEAIKKKEKLIKELLKLTKEQEKIINDTDFDDNSFNRTLKNKERLIKQIEEVDNGFQSTYDRIQGVLKNQIQLYEEKIKTLQDIIKTVSDIAIEIQVLEQKNKTKLKVLFQNNRKKVKEFKQNKSVANNYYKNMSNSHINQSYFMDKKK